MVFVGNLAAQQKINNLKVITADSAKADIKIADEWYLKRWSISPQIENDSLKIKIYGGSENISFRTNRDSISYVLRPGQSKSFYVKLGNAAPAHTIISAEAFQWNHISYNNEQQRKDVRFFYSPKDNPYYNSLRDQYPIKDIYAKDKDDTERVLSIMNWVHNRWKHNGANSPKGMDGISILNEAKAGGRFPCFAYAIVLRDQLIANGYTARVLYLKFKDAEKSEGAPGHVVSEVYLKDKKKWVFIDGQFNVMPMLKGQPLNAVEFQHALSTNYDGVTLNSREKVSKKNYTDFVYDYLFYFNTALDNRVIPAAEKFLLEEKREIMLVPIGANNLTKMKFFDTKLDYFIYTHSSADFYAKP